MSEQTTIKVKKAFDIDVTLAKLKTSIELLDSDTQRKLLDWVNSWSGYIADESEFKPEKLVHYKRGLIVFADLGFNCKYEFGGRHFAIVVEKDNHKTNGTVTVVPLRSLDEGETETDIDEKNEIYLGEGVIPFNSSFKTVAKVNQICSISKMRIYRPKYKKHDKSFVDGKILTKIDDKIKELFIWENANK